VPGAIITVQFAYWAAVLDNCIFMFDRLLLIYVRVRAR